MEDILPVIQFFLLFMMLFHFTFWKGVYLRRVLLTSSAAGESYHHLDLLSKKPQVLEHTASVSPPRATGTSAWKYFKDFVEVHIVSSMCPIMRSHKMCCAMACWQQRAEKLFGGGNFGQSILKVAPAVSPPVKPEESAKMHGLEHLTPGRSAFCRSDA